MWLIDLGSGLLPRLWRRAVESWLRGVDLNHRPLGYEAIDLLLSSSIYGTSGIVRNRKEASGERFGSRMGVGFDRLRLWV